MKQIRRWKVALRPARQITHGTAKMFRGMNPCPRKTGRNQKHLSLRSETAEWVARESRLRSQRLRISTLLSSGFLLSLLRGA